MYVTEGERVYVLPAAGSPGWSSRALQSGEATVRFPGAAERAFRARLEIDPASQRRVRALFEQKYGAARWARYFPEEPRVLVLEPGAGPSRRSPALLVREEFEAVATSYWASVEQNPVERYLKSRSIEWLERELAGRDPLLEIGPGPGIETLPLLHSGHRVTAVDMAPGMLAELRRRAEAIGAADRLTCRRADLATLEEDLPDLDSASFQGAYSTFGAFNLEPDLGLPSRGLARLLAPGAPLLLGVLNRWALAPLVYEGLNGGFRPVRARLQRPIPAEEIRYPLDVWSWTPDEHDRALEPYFVRVALEPVSVLAPPFRVDRWLARANRDGRRLALWLDGRFLRFPGAALGSEWLFLAYRRTDVPVAPRPG